MPLRNVTSSVYLGSAAIALSFLIACGDGDNARADDNGSTSGKGGSASGKGGSSAAGTGGSAGVGKGGSGGSAGVAGESGSGGTGESGSAGAGDGGSAAGEGGAPGTGEAGTPGTAGGSGHGGVPGEAGAGGASGTGGGGGPRLVVADAEAQHLYVLSVPNGEILADLSGVTFAEHSGFLPLDDGRVLFVDAVTEQLAVLDALAETPRIVRRIALGAAPVHLAVDRAQNWAAVTGAGRFTLVRLDDYSSKIVSITTGEPGVLLGGEPVHLYHRNDSPPVLESYLMSALFTGTVEVVDTQAISEFPHGEAIVHAANKILAAADDGINVVPATNGTFGEPVVIPYAVGDRSGGRAFYARLSADSRFLYSYLRNSGPNFDWAWRDWENDAFIVDVELDEAQRLEIGNGLVYRMADSRQYALFVQYHPDGDFAHLLDTDSDSPTFHTFIAKIPLEAMTSTPTGVDADPWSSTAFRIAGMLPSGELGFVTHGGDGKISIIDTARREVSAIISLPTSLDYGGYLLGVEPGTAWSDTVGR